jgi:integrase/recombinase XerD
MKTYLEPDEIRQLTEAAKNVRDKLLILLSFRGALRISEALLVGVDDIDFQNGTVTIEHLKFRLRIECPYCHAGLGRRHGFCPRCGKQVTDAIRKEQEQRRQRIIPIDKETLDLIKEFDKQGGPVIKNGKRVLFGINRHRAWQIVRECAERAGLPKLVNPETGKIHNVSPHKLRDAFAINALKNDNSGEGQRFLQEHLGHQSFNTIARYRKTAGEEHREWYDKLWKKDKS